jgi:opacity protein-like surface antigen
MSFIGLAVAVAFAQSPQPTVVAPPPPSATPAPAVEMSATDKATAAAERAAMAAEKANQAIQRLADVLAGPPLTAATPSAGSAWIGSFGAGLSFITGNTSQLTLTGQLGLDRKFEVWAVGIRVNGAYGLANPTGEANRDQTTARRGSATVRGDRSFGSGFASIYALGGLEFDHVKNIELRGFGEAGAGLLFFNRKENDFEKLYLRFDIGLRGGYETRFQYFPFPVSLAEDQRRAPILAPRLALAFRWSFSKDVRFSQELEAIPYLLAPSAGRLLLNSNTKLNARLTENLSLATGLLLAYDSQPPGPKQGEVGARRPLDVTFTAGLEATF